MPTSKAKHAATQRRYAARLKDQRAPTYDEMAHVLLKAARICLEAHPEHGTVRRWGRLFEATVEELVERGFDRGEARRQLSRALHLDSKTN